MNIALARLMACLTLAGLFAFYRHPAPPDLSSPKAAARSFVAAINQKDAAALIACVAGAKETPEVSIALKTMMATMKFDINEPVAEISGDTARVAVAILASEEMAKGIMPAETLDMKKEGGVWKIVPNSASLKSLESKPAAERKTPILRIYAAIASGSPELLQVFRMARDRAKEVNCLNNGKQLGLASIMYVQDYDERYPPKSASFKTQIMPYVRSEAPFTCLLDPPGTQSYSYNKYLQGRSVAIIMKPEKTILFYEGKDMKPNFRHDGKAMIAFADGHAKLCSAADMKGLVWKEAEWAETLSAKPVAKPKTATKKKKKP